jgi:hypothetical protein
MAARRAAVPWGSFLILVLNSICMKTELAKGQMLAWHFAWCVFLERSVPLPHSCLCYDHLSLQPRIQYNCAAAFFLLYLGLLCHVLVGLEVLVEVRRWDCDFFIEML